MKLYLTLEEGERKAERVIEVDENSVADHEKMGVHIEEMFDQIEAGKEEDLVEEAKRLTQHND